MKKEFPDDKQRSAVCYRKWDDKKAKAIGYAYPHITSRIFNVPLLITSARLDEIIMALNSHMKLALNLDAQLQNSDDDTFYYYPVKKPKESNNDSIAIIPVSGTLVHKSGYLESRSGIQSYNQIKSMFDEALDNPGYKRILWDFGSPGGELAGFLDLADYIYARREEKPMVAVVNESAYSAAYGLASAVGNIVVTRTAGVGSIGVIYRHVDMSKADENAGLKYIEIAAGAKKGAVSPHKPLSEDTIQSIQERVNDAYNLFVSTVARNLNISEKIIRDTEAATYAGQKAIDAGLAHKLASYTDAINYLLTLKGESNMNAQAASNDKSPEIIAAETLIGQLRSEIDEHKDRILQLQKDIAVKTEAEIVEERARTLELIRICDLHNTQILLSDFISKGISVDGASKQILETLNTRSKTQTVINNQTKGDSTGEPNPLLETCKKRAAEARI